MIATKIADANGRVAKLLAKQKPAAEQVADLYLTTLCRRPTPAEVEFGTSYLAGAPSPQEGLQDLLWGLMNSKQFLFVY